MSTSAYNDRGQSPRSDRNRDRSPKDERSRDRSSFNDGCRGQGRGYSGDPDRSNKRRRDNQDDDRANKRRRNDQDNDRDTKRSKQDHRNNRNHRPQQSQDDQFRNRNKKQEHRKDGGKERTPAQVDVIKEENKRLRAELKALKECIAAGEISVQNDHTTSAQLSHSDAVAKLPAPEETLTDVALYTPFTVSRGLPQLPPVASEKLRSAVFKHKSIYSQHRDGGDGIVTYEKLEYLGDAYLELFASRLIYHRFPNLSAGHMSRDRETLVKNETLAQFSRAYGFDAKVEVDKSVKTQMEQDKANKGFNKVLGDVFEAYVAAVCLSHEDGFAAAEKWLTALWAPKILELYHAHRTLIHSDDADPLGLFNPTATEELSHRLGSGKDCKLDYTPVSTIEMKGDQLGQNLWLVQLRLTGYGHTSRLLATAKGANQKEAKAWAAIKAMHGETKSIIEECESKLHEVKAQRIAQKEKEKESQDKQPSNSVKTQS